MGDNDPTKILILAANPRRYEDLRLGEQVRDIKEGLARSLYRDNFKIESRWAVRKRDFYRHILDFQPQILHFCGHGEGENGIVLEDEIGAAHLVSTDALTSFFRLFTEIGLEGVVLNAGYSAVQAKAISQVVNYVIGMNQQISDEAALDFAVAFYDGLGAGKTVKFAFDLGCVTLTDLGAAEIPQLKQKQFRQKQLGLPSQLANKPENPPCPYQGLSFFSEKDQDFFFGREVFTKQLLEAVENKSLVGLIGASGSGKSSVVFAGLIPQLRRQEVWLIVSNFRPGKEPFDNLVDSLIDSLEKCKKERERSEDIKYWVDILKNKDQKQNLGYMVNRILKKNNCTRCLLIIDQFEELYTLCQDTTEREAFLAELLLAISQDNFQIVFTLRADFFSEALDYRPFADALNTGNVNLSPMNPEELHSAITKPAKLLGVNLEKGLTERILEDVGNKSENLPLVEFALTELWKKQKNKKLTHEGYKEIGGIKQALVNYAQHAYEHKLNQQEQKIAQHILLQLVRLGEGTEDTRRIVLQQDLVTKNYSNQEVADVVQKLVKERLVVRELNQGEAMVTVIHEALILNWPQLRTWLDESREILLFQRKIEAAAREWKRQNKKHDYLWRGRLLREAQRFIKERGEKFPLSQEAVFFVERSGKKRRENRVRTIGFFLILPLIVTPWVGYQIDRRLKIQRYWQTVNDIQEKEHNSKRNQALEKLGKLGEELRHANLQGVFLDNIALNGANLSSALLYGANLNSAKLDGANLNSARLDYANLNITNLNGANLSSAILYDAHLNFANLSSANLNGASFFLAILNDANLKNANLRSANLRFANLNRVNLENANLENANLSNAMLIDAKKLTLKQIKSACNWEKAFYKGEYNKEKFGWIVDEEANKKYIEKLKADKASDPEKPVDCNGLI